MTLFVNGRFLAQSRTGVQRYAEEVVCALKKVAADRGGPQVDVRVPSGSAWASQLAGYVWDQILFPLKARGGVLLGLGNLGPVWIRRQVVVLHDAAVYDVPGSYRPSYRLAHRLVHRALLARGARLATVSAFSQERLAAALRIPPEAIAVTGVGSEHIGRAAADPHVLARLGLAPERYVLAVAGRAAHKNLKILEKAAAPLADRGLPLVLVGGTAAPFADHGEPLHGLFACGPLRDGELRALYEQALALVFPSLYEGFGLPPLEAMRLGCPVLIARVRPLLDHFGQAALSFEADEVRELVAQIDRLRSDRDLRAELAARGHRVAARWTWSDVAAKLLDLVRPLDAGEALPACAVQLPRTEAEAHG